MRKLMIGLVGAALLAGCGEDPNAIRFDGQIYKGKAKAISRDDRAAFVVTSGPADISLQGAREAGEYEANKYCIRYLGTTDIEWINGPYAEEADLVIEGGKLVLTGRCLEP